MAGCNLPEKLWPLGLSTTVYLKNRAPTKAVKEGITPIQKLTNTVPDLSHLRVWGCIAYLRLPEETPVKSSMLLAKNVFLWATKAIYCFYGMDIR